MTVDKVLKWAGFTYYDNPVVFGPGDGTKSGWYYPDGWKCWILPGFLNDFNACEKYLIPKIEDLQNMYLYPRENGWDLHIVVCKYIRLSSGILYPSADTIYVGEGKCIATAFCEALIQLIDKEED